MSLQSAIAIILIVPVILLGFAAFTRHAWEDFYITYRASENLATGHGFVFTSGERLHTYTSPLGALIPAGLRLAMGDVTPEAVLWAFRVLSACVLGLGLVALAASCRRLGLGGPASVLIVGLIALDLKTIDNAINGMETALLIAGLAGLVWTMAATLTRRWAWIGGSCAWLLWVRPDSFVYFGALAGAWIIFQPAGLAAQGRRDGVLLLAKAAVVCALLYLPWLAISTAYYGTPIPHTVTAKGLTIDRQPLELVGQAVLFPLKVFTPGSPFRLLFTPAYVDVGGWPVAMRLFSYGLGAVATLLVLCPGVSARSRTFSLVTYAGGFYLDAICPYPAPWYVPATAFFAALALGSGLHDLLATWASPAVSRASRIAVTLALGIQGAVTVAGAIQLRHQQRIIEDGNRREIGLWLKSHASTPRDTVFLECLGYIGYFSGLKMLDHPGLSSLEMVNARRELRTDDWARLILHLQPDWLVLRPKEATRISESDRTVLETQYRLVKRFDVSDQVAQEPWVPGRAYLTSDQTFVVYHRSPATAP